MPFLTEQRVDEIISDLGIMLTIHHDMSDIETLSSQLRTFLKQKHDFWLECVFQELIEQNKDIKKEPEWKGYTPDLILNLETHCIVMDVTFTLNKKILDEKIKKYTELLDDQDDFILIDNTETAERMLGLVNCIEWKKKFLFLTDRLLSKFLNECETFGVSTEMLRNIESLHYMGIYKPNYKINFSRKLRKVEEYLPKDERENYPLEEKLDIISDTIRNALNGTNELNKKFELQKMETGNYTDSYKNCVHNIKKTFKTVEEIKASFLVYTPLEVENVFGKPWKTEQELLKLQFDFLSRQEFPLQDLFNKFNYSLRDLYTNNVFKNSVPLSTQEEPDMRLKYQNYYHEVLEKRKTGEDIELIPFIDFCLSDAGLEITAVNSKTRKTLTVSSALNDKCQSFIKKSKTNMSKADYLSSKLNKMETIKRGDYKLSAIDPGKYDYKIEKHIKQLTQEVNRQIPEEIFRMLYKPGEDAPLFQQLKEQSLADFRIFLNCLRYTPLLTNMVDITRHLNQLLHFQNLVFKHNNFSMFNSGIPNIMYLVQHGIQDRGRDVGRSYLIFKFGDISDTEKQLYGFCNSYLSNDRKTKFHMTNWRRLSSQRIGFHLDQIYSVLSTSFASFQRRLSESRTSLLPLDQVFAETKVIFCIRYLVSISHRQLFAEMLSDIRYLYMDAFSDFADCNQFVIDKYAKPIQTDFECYLLLTIPKFEKFRTEFLSTGVSFKTASFKSGVRDQHSIGGKINLPSILYPGVRIRNIQDLLDDMFLYVHTNKDPSTPYHEYVKAYKTIIKYQQLYDNLPYNRKKGILKNNNEVEEFLITDNGVGFWGLATNTAAQLVCNRFDKNILKQKIINLIRNDTILDMNSTKSIIPERERETEITEYDDIFTSQFKGDKRKLRKKTRELWENLEQHKENPYYFTITTKRKERDDNLIVLSGTNRCKVHDSTKDFVEHTNIRTTLELALWNINSNKSRVATDICIKAQYGAKREFYVINHGAKAMARILEQCFKIICSSMEEEMISVSGDKKMYNIQGLLDRALLNSKGKNKKIFYCNGDCTKWSAAETMECLLKFTQGFSDLFSPELLTLLSETLMAWGSKDIFVPSELLKNVFFDLPGVSEHLKQSVFKSTQNFLQGMFNYLSSCKAVACSELTREIWKRLYPDDTSELYHMEHSDDYAFIFLTDSAETFSKFKKVHRIVMRFLGISDSTKKTNCQQFLLEFISLISFNGVMVYPQIKKIKEVGLNIGCLGYAADIMTTCSRVGEACRMGVPGDVAYIMGRIQNVRIASSYGLFSSNKELYYSQEFFNKGWTSIPVQLWGIPDVHPIFYLFSKGDPNNYRLFTYGSESTKKTIKTLFLLNNCEQLINEEEYQEDRIEFTNGLFHPNYTYLRNSKLLTNIRKRLKYTLDDSQKYWEAHPLDLLTKPVDPDRYKDWLFSKYYQKSFGEAYMRQGRVQLMLRLSHFVKQKCLSLNLSIEKLKEFFNPNVIDKLEDSLNSKLSIIGVVKIFKTLEDSLQNLNIESKLFIPTLYGFDQVSKYIYTHFSIGSITLTNKITRDTKAYPEPTRKFEYTCTNDPIKVLQFIVSPNDFYKDNRKMSDITTLLKDIEIIKNIARKLEINLSKISIKEINIISGIAITSRGGGKPLLLSFNPANDLLHSITKYVENHSFTGRLCSVDTGLYEEFVPRSDSTMLDTELHSVQHPLEYGWELETPELLNDIAMVLAFLCGLGIKSDIARKILQNIKFDLDKTITSKDYIDKISNMYLSNQLKLTNSQTQMICSLADFVNNNPLPITKYLDTKLGYKYEYRQATPKKGMTTVYLTTLGENFMLVFNETKGKSGHNLTIVSSTKKLQLLPVVYLTGLRLMGAISINEFVKRMERNTLQYVIFQTPLDVAKGKFVYVNELTHQYSFNQNPFIDKIMPVILVEKLNMPVPSLGDEYHKVLKFDYNNLSAYSGKAKIFTLQVKHLVQFNCWSSSDKAKEFNINFLLHNNVLKKIFTEDYNLNSEEFYLQSCNDTIERYRPKDRRKNKFRITDQKKINNHRKELEKKLEINKKQLNPNKYGFYKNIYFEDIQHMTARNATDYMFGNMPDVEEGRSYKPDLVEAALDDVLDFDVEIEEDLLQGGGFGDYSSALDSYPQSVLDTAQAIYKDIREFIRNKLNPSDKNLLLEEFPFITTDVKIDLDISDERYKGLGVNKTQLCDMITYGYDLFEFQNSMNDVIEKINDKQKAEVKLQITEEIPSETEDIPVQPTQGIAFDESNNPFGDDDSLFGSDSGFDFDVTHEDEENENKVEPIPVPITYESNPFPDDSDLFSDSEEEEPIKNVQSFEQQTIPSYESNPFPDDSDLFSSDDEETKESEAAPKEIKLELAGVDPFGDDDLFSSGSENNMIDLEESVNEPILPEKEEIQMPVFEGEDPFGDDDLFSSGSENNMIDLEEPSTTETPINIQTPVYVDYYESFDGIFETAQKLLERVESIPVIELYELFPGPTSAFRTLRQLEETNPELLTKYFPNYSLAHKFDDNNIRVNEQSVVHKYNLDGFYNVSADMRFKFHGTSSCDCKFYKTKYQRSEMKLCTMTMVYGRSLLISNRFFETFSEAIEAYELIQKNIGIEKTNDIFRLEKIPKKYTKNKKITSMKQWLEILYMSDVELTQDVLEHHEKLSHAVDEEEDPIDFVPYTEELFDITTNPTTQRHPKELTTSNIEIEETDIKFMHKKPFSLLQIMECIDKFYLKALEYKYLGSIRFKDLTPLSKLNAIKMLDKMIGSQNVNKLEYKYANLLLKKWDISLLPNTQKTHIIDSYYHSIVDGHSIVYKHINLTLRLFESLLDKIQSIENVTFNYNANDTVDLYTPTNDDDINIAESSNLQSLLGLIGEQTEIGKEITMLNKELEYGSFLDNLL